MLHPDQSGRRAADAQRNTQHAQRNTQRPCEYATQCATGPYLDPPARPTNEAEIIRAGHALLDAKALLHGEFVAWVEAHCEFSVRSAQNYMAQASKGTPWDGEMDWLSMPGELPMLRGCEPLTSDETDKLAQFIREELERVGEPDQYGLLGSLAQTACAAAPHVTAGDVQRAIAAHGKLLEVELRRVEGVAAAFARLPADARLWFSRANQHWHETDDEPGTKEKLSVLNAGRFDTRHFHARMLDIADGCPDLVHPEAGVVAWPPQPVWPSSDADVEAYRGEVTTWRASVPAFIAKHYPQLINRERQT